MKIDDFNLNKSVAETIRAYAENNSFPQTMLIEGGDMDARITFANFLANMILCTGGEKPCGSCPACVKCAADSHPDVKKYGGEKANETFKVEISRDIKQDAFVIPNDGDKKVFIIRESQNMNDASENALLKIFEEPPYFDYFIMTCDSRSAMLDTILSRATVINIGEYRKEYSRQAVDLAESIAKALCADSEITMLEKLAPLQSEKEIFAEVTACFKEILLDSIVCKQTQNNNSDYCDSVEQLCAKLTVNKLYDAVGVVTELEAAFSQNANYNLLITSMSAKLCAVVYK